MVTDNPIHNSSRYRGFFRSTPVLIKIVIGDAERYTYHQKLALQLNITEGALSFLYLQKIKAEKPFNNVYLMSPDLPLKETAYAVKALRAKSDVVPIIAIRPDDLFSSKKTLFEVGIDDVVCLNCPAEELNFRIAALLRRFRLPPGDKNLTFNVSDLSFDYSRLKCRIGSSHEHRLTKRQADVLRFLCEHPDVLVSRSEILLFVWGKVDYFLGRSMDVVIHQLRRILALSHHIFIETVHGEGFVLHQNKNMTYGNR